MEIETQQDKFRLPAFFKVRITCLCCRIPLQRILFVHPVVSSSSFFGRRSVVIKKRKDRQGWRPRVGDLPARIGKSRPKVSEMSQIPVVVSPQSEVRANTPDPEEMEKRRSQRARYVIFFISENIGFSQQRGISSSENNLRKHLWKWHSKKFWLDVSLNNQSELFRRPFSEVFSEVIFAGRDTPSTGFFSCTFMEMATHYFLKLWGRPFLNVS